MIREEIQNMLFAEQDKPYAAFTAKLIPTIDPQTVIGVRIPTLRSMAKALLKRDDLEAFLSDLPHQFFEENQLHVLLLSLQKDFERLLLELDGFLPYIDNWATCDILAPKIIAKHLPDFLPYIQKCLSSEHEYTVRFGVGMLMSHYLGDAFDLQYPKWVASIHSDAYYVNMMIAWYFATALAKQYEEIVPFIEQKRLSPWTHNKAIQKAIESRRISSETKSYLRLFKR
jgi:3-methyladenine DNA glycosylase AlkD